MKKFPTKKVLLDILGIYNPHMLAQIMGKKYVWIYFSPQCTGRAYHSAKYQVTCNGYSTDPNADWMDNGNKTFRVGILSKEEALEKAKSWVDTKYGKKEWIRDPFGSWQQVSILAALEEALIQCGAIKEK